MEAFTYKNGTLHAEDVPLRTLAEAYGTPLYVYSRSYMIAQYDALKSALADFSPSIHFAMKSNSNAAVIHLFAELGAGADVVSGGELKRAVAAGIDPAHVAFAGVGKTREEIDQALEADIGFFTVESEPELERISERAQAIGKTGRIALRVNPDVDPKTHKHTNTGKKESKFGVDLDRALRAYEEAAALPGIEVAGLHMHLGSPIMSIDPYVQALEKITPVCVELKAKYPSFRHLDLGGGMGIPYKPDDKPFDVDAFAAAVIPYFEKIDMQIHLEPGRYLTGNAGVLLCTVQYVKDNPFKKFIVVDGAMNDLIRPVLYEAYHGVKPVKETSETLFGDVVGPVCETGDFFAFERELPAVTQDDLLVIESAGAYGFVMASTYNSRPRPAEVMVSGDRHELVRERESVSDLARGERIPDWS